MFKKLEAAFRAILTAWFLCLELSVKFLSYFDDVDYSIEVTKFVSSSVPQSQKVLCFVLSHSVSSSSNRFFSIYELFVVSPNNVITKFLA